MTSPLQCGQFAQAPGSDGRRLRRSHTRDRLLAAARTLMRNGVWRPTVQEVSKVAGVSPRTIYEIFIDREALYGAALEDVVVVQAIAKAVLGGLPPAGHPDAIAHAAVFGRPRWGSSS